MSWLPASLCNDTSLLVTVDAFSGAEKVSVEAIVEPTLVARSAGMLLDRIIGRVTHATAMLVTALAATVPLPLLAVHA